MGRSPGTAQRGVTFSGAVGGVRGAGTRRSWDGRVPATAKVPPMAKSRSVPTRRRPGQRVGRVWSCRARGRLRRRTRCGGCPCQRRCAAPSGHRRGTRCPRCRRARRAAPRLASGADVAGRRRPAPRSGRCRAGPGDARDGADRRRADGRVVAERLRGGAVVEAPACPEGQARGVDHRLVGGSPAARRCGAPGGHAGDGGDAVRGVVDLADRAVGRSGPLGDEEVARGVDGEPADRAERRGHPRDDARRVVDLPDGRAGLVRHVEVAGAVEAEAGDVAERGVTDRPTVAAVPERLRSRSTT